MTPDKQESWLSITFITNKKPALWVHPLIFIFLIRVSSFITFLIYKFSWYLYFASSNALGFPWIDIQVRIINNNLKKKFKIIFQATLEYKQINQFHCISCPWTTKSYCLIDVTASIEMSYLVFVHLVFPVSIYIYIALISSWGTFILYCRSQSLGARKARLSLNANAENLVDFRFLSPL